MSKHPSSLFTNAHLEAIRKSARDLLRSLHNGRNEVCDVSLVNPLATTIESYFHSFPFILKMDPKGTVFPVTYETIDSMQKWADAECKEKVAHRVFSVISRSNFDSADAQWIMNDIAGEEHCFWAFMNEQDMLMFAMRW